MTEQKSLLACLLLGELPRPRHQGRVVRFGRNDPDLQYITGNVSERIMHLLRAISEPMTTAEITRGIASNHRCVAVALNKLVRQNEVVRIKVAGEAAEFMCPSHDVDMPENTE